MNDDESWKMFGEFLQEPEFRARFLRSYETSSREIAQHILEQRYFCDFAYVDVIRDGTILKIEWRFKDFITEPEDYIVVGNIRRATLIPDPEYAMDKTIANAHGNGRVTVRLKEGSFYYFRFTFIDGKYTINKSTKESLEHVKMLDFHVGAPFSSANQAIVDKALKAETNPEERIRQGFETRMKMEDAFDEMTKQGIKKIKEKKLPPKEEEDRINRFLEQVERMKDDCGM